MWPGRDNGVTVTHNMREKDCKHNQRHKEKDKNTCKMYVRDT